MYFKNLTELAEQSTQLNKSNSVRSLRIELQDKIETRTSKGMLSKGWYKIDGILYLVKGNSIEDNNFCFEPYSEVLASRLLNALGFNVVLYNLMDANLFKEIKVKGIGHVSMCKSHMLPNTNYFPFSRFVDAREGAILSSSAYLSWLIKNEILLPLEYVLKMLIGDAFIGNEDRHLNNWDIGENKDGLFYPPIIDF